MTRHDIFPLEDEPGRVEEALTLAERLKNPADDKEFQECVRELMDSPVKRALVLQELELDRMVLLRRTTREQKAASGGDEESPLPRRSVWERLRALTAPALIAAAVGAIALLGVSMYLQDSSELAPMASLEHRRLPDRSVMTRDPDTSASIRYTFEKRGIELHSGGAEFEVGPGGRPFFVDTPLWTVKALGTRFYVRLIGSADDLKTLVRVGRGSVRLEARRSSAEPLTLAPNQQVLLTANGHGEVADLSKRGQLAQFTGEPLARLAAEFNQRGRDGPRFLVEGKACWYTVSGKFDLDDWTSLMDHVRLDRALKVSGNSDVIVVRSAAETSPVQGAAQNGCGLDVQPPPAVSPASDRP